MIKQVKKTIYITLSFLLIASSFMIVPSQAKAESSNLPNYSSPIDLTAPLNGSPLIYDGVAGIEDGRNVMYTTSKSVPAEFSVIDIDTNEVIRTLPMVGATDSWQHKIAPDGTVYVTGGKSIWGYSPVTKEITALHQIPDSSVWALAVDEDSNAYIGTYPGGKVVKYDKETKKIHDYGKMIGDISQEYVRSLGYHDGYIYAGTAHTQLVRLNLETGEKVNLTEGFDETGFVYDLDIVDDRYVFARFGTSANMYIYDIQEEKWLDVVLENSKGLHVTDSLDNNVYYSADGKIKYINLDSLEITETNMAYTTGFRGADWVEINGDDRLPGKSLVTIMFDGRITFFNIETETVVTYPAVVPATANVTASILSYSKDKMYISGMTGAVGAVYNPLTEGVTQFNLGQADVIHEFEGKIYFGVYPSGSVHVLDPTVNPNGPTTNLFTIGNEQDRVHHMTSGDGKLFVGSVATYGKLGGAITVYDGTSHKVFRDVIKDQSINGLAYKAGNVYGSTSIFGGLGSEPTTNEAKVFIWNPETEVVTKEAFLEIPGLATPERIGSLITGMNDDYIWGSAGGVIFALNDETLEVEKQVRIESRQLGGDVQLEWDENGLLYANIGENLYVVNPETLDYKYVASTVSFDIGMDGDIYFSKLANRTIVSKVEVLDGVGGPVRKYLEVENADFESDLVDGEIPGWSIRELANNTSIELSEERALSGNKSIKLVDATTTGTAALQSELLEVEPGQEYTAGASVYLDKPAINPGTGEPFSSNRTVYQVRYYDKDKNEINLTAGLGMIFQGALETWHDGEFTSVAPDNAKYIRILVSSNNAYVSNVYYDDVYVYTTELPSINEVDPLNDLSVKFGTKLDNVNLPAKVNATLSNGNRVSVDINWDGGEPAYDGNTPGVYAFSGTLDSTIENPKDLTVNMNVTVEEQVVEEPDDTVKVYLDIMNADFENDLVDGEIPGWSLGEQAEHTSTELSEERSLSGNRSIKLIDATTSGHIVLQSDLLEVKPGEYYTAGANVFLDTPPVNPETGSSFGTSRAMYQVRYYDADQNEIDLFLGLGVAFDGAIGEWHSDEFTSQAPEEAKYMRVRLASSNAWVTNAYFDDVYVYTEEDLAVTGIQEIDNIAVEYGTAQQNIELPQTASVTLNSQEEIEVEITWDSGTPEYDGNSSGIYVFSGALTLPEGVLNPDELIAVVNVTVLEQPVEPEEPRDPTLDELSMKLEEYIDSGEVRGPLVNQLQNSLKQAEHHLNKGSDQKAADFVEKFLKHLNNKPMQKHIGAEAKIELTEMAENLINTWLN